VMYPNPGGAAELAADGGPTGPPEDGPCGRYAPPGLKTGLHWMS